MPRFARIPRTDFSDAAPFKIDGVYCKLIPLTRGQYAIVYESRYEELARFNWSAYFSKTAGSYYAYRNCRDYERIDGKDFMVQMHRQILGLGYGDKRQGDHQNRLTMDNRDANLRVADRARNQQNSKRRSKNKSGFKGVCWIPWKRQYAATIKYQKKQIWLGYRHDPAEAYKLYVEAAKRLFGEFARLE